MSPTLSQLKGFVAVAEELHFGRAAERLHLTQPTLTRNIQNLERAVHAKLLERGGKEISLTVAGALVLADARRIISIAEALPQLAHKAEAGEVGTLRLAFTAMGAYAVLNEFLTYVNNLFPSVDINIVEMVSEAQFEALANGELDVGLARPAVPEMFGSRHLHSEEMVAALPAGHGLADAPGPLTLEGAMVGDYIAYSSLDQKYFHDMCATMLNLDRFLTSHSVSEIPAMLALVRAGRGMALVPKSATLLRVDGVVYRELDPVESRRVSLSVCWNPDNSNPALRALLPHLDRMPTYGSPITDSESIQELVSMGAPDTR
ncbi:LysR family transcriptional regulator [Arthrobacter sp. AK01]|uniref:LysR family transcriptional regulator n=1 Tax=Micrococcaceae TaxID=1268 RepID=UPI001E419B05|nr:MULTISPECIES: LysR family transcriptional regulator [Micrococcaceae]MCD4851611.1 LysR family transcriptional regulator [Arthrobacter sp. AK01]MCP1413791.1 DNA-binding transcriptional LysR family regulator [Paenarthrobacter sp. A20]